MKFTWPLAVRITCNDPNFIVEGGVYPGWNLDPDYGPVVHWFEGGRERLSEFQHKEEGPDLFEWIDHEGRVFRMTPMTPKIWNAELVPAREGRRKFKTIEELTEFLKGQWGTVG